jgi:Trypsin-co-occurring domain 2
MSKAALAETIADLRSQLEIAAKDAEASKERIRFEVGEVQVQLSVEVEVDAKAGVHVWVIEAGASASRTSTHTLTVPLTPFEIDPVTKARKSVITSGRNVPS